MLRPNLPGSPSGGSHIWLLDLKTGGSTQLTFGSGRHGSPVWSPDAARLAFTKTPNELYQKAVSGAGDEELLLRLSDTDYLVATDWSSDGRYLIYTKVDPQTKGDIWALANPTDPARRKPLPVLRTEFSEHGASLSADGRWIAYISNETGRDEIFVRPFAPHSGEVSGAGGKWRISHEGGISVQWRQDGRELFYMKPDRALMSVEIATQPVFRAGAQRSLFRAGPWRVTPDGSRFLVLAQDPNEKAAPFAVVMNWLAALKK